jgi:hypothetical protein
MSEQPVNREGIAEKRFEFSPENPPPIEVLESKVFAVHATPILPEGGVLKAGARDITYDKKWDDEPPTFRPTVHFALGELAREHDGFSWDEEPFAVVSPLKALEPQLVNVFPHDTFVLGDYRLTEDDILLVPRGTDTSKLPPSVKVLEYNGGMGVRHAVDQVIRDKDGWPIRMKSEGVSIGSVAYIDDVEVNSAEFFQSLFDKSPHISFGTHLNPERGDAFRFGIIEQGINQAMKTYSDHWSRYSTIQVQLHKSLVTHNLEKLETSLRQAQGLAPEALQVFEAKKQKLAGWMNVIDADLEVRERLGRTLSGAPEWVQKQVQAHRYDPDQLRQTIDRLASSLPDAVEEEEMSPSFLAEMLNGMPPNELKEFMAKNQRVFNNTDLPTFYADYAVNRWIVVKDKKATEEGLDRMLSEALPQITPKEDRRFGESEVFNEIKEHLTSDSNRLATALRILQQPSVRQYLTERYGFDYPESGLKTLGDVLHAHPETKRIFEQQQLSLSEEQRTAYDILKSLGMVHEPRYDKSEALESFHKASSFASELRWSGDRLGDKLERITQPMNSARDLDEVPPGTMLRLYELLKRDNDSATEVWSKLGLEEEFRREFSDERSFWSSDESLFDIYKRLSASRQRNN